MAPVSAQLLKYTVESVHIEDVGKGHTHKMTRAWTV